MKAYVLPVLFGLSLMATVSTATATTPLTTLPTAAHYSLAYEIFPEDGRLEARAEVTVENRSGAPVTEWPFLLYRLFEVHAVTDVEGGALPFGSRIVRDHDSPTLHGYREVWGYVRDTISEEYTLLRDDTLAYPILALPMRASRYADRRFTYDLEMTVPEGYVVASGGRSSGARTAIGRTTFSYASKVPVWRFDVAVARFSVRRSDDGDLAVFVLPGHEEGADRVLDAMRDAVDLYTDLFGSVGDFQGYTAIEIPKGWGSQAADLYFLQTAAAFEDADRILEVYHEVGHNWNAKPRPDVQRCRYFDEAFASYFQALALRAFDGDQAWLDEMESSRQVFVRWTERDPAYLETPIVDYGKHEIGHLSYSKGAWSLYVLQWLVGESSAVGFEDFERIASEVSGRDLGVFFTEWLHGAESSRLLVEKVPIDEILARYM